MIDLSRCEWRKSSRSGNNSACVEVAVTPATVGIRDTKNRTSGQLAVTADEWRSFIRHL